MASGVNGNIQIDCGSGFWLRVRYHEDYDTANNYSNFIIDGIDAWSDSKYGYDYYPDGKVYIDGTCVLTMDSRIPDGSVYIQNKGSWYTISNTGCRKNNITHADNGTKAITVGITGNRYSSFSMFTVNGNGGSGWGTSSNHTVTLTTIPRASQPSCITYPDNTQNVGDLGGTITIHMNRKSSSFTHTVKYTFGNASGTIATNVADNCQWTIPLDLAKQIPSATSGYGTITVTTYNGSTNVGSKNCRFDITVPASMKPTVSSVGVTIDNSANDVIKEWGLYVAGYSKAKITAAASGSYGSTISSFTISGGYSATQSGDSLSYTGDTFKSTGDKTFKIVAKDSRGRTSDAVSTETITVYAYSNPSISSFAVMRNESNSRQMVISANWSFSSVNGMNSITIKLQYKKHSDSSWTTYDGDIAKNSSTTLDVAFDEASSYDFKLTITDAVGKSSSSTAFVSTLAVLLDFRAGGKGLGIGKIAETDTMEVAIDAIFMGAIYIQDSSGNKVSLADYIKSVVG